MDVDLAALWGEAERDDDKQVETVEEDKEIEVENEHERAIGDDVPENDAPENDMPEDFCNMIHYLTTYERREGLMRKRY